LTEKAATFLRQAGERALAIYANAEAESLYRELAEVFSQLGQPAEAASALEQVARVLARQARYNEALGVLEETLSAYRATTDLERQAQIIFRIGHLHGYRGTSEAGIALLEPWLQAHAESSISAEGRGRVALTLGYLYSTNGRHAEAVERVEHAIDWIKQGGEESLGIALAHLGRILILLNRQEEALPQLKAALPLVERAREAFTLHSVLLNINLVYELRGALDDAKEYAERALTLAKQLGSNTHMGATLNNHGYNAFQRGDWGLAREEYEQAITILRQAGLPWGATHALWNRGMLLMVQGQWESAAPYYEEALALAWQRKELDAFYGVQSDLAERDLVSGLPETAYERLMPLLADLTKRESGTMEPLTMLAWALVERGELDQAQRLLDQVLPYATEQHLHPVVVMALLVQARLTARRGSLVESQQALDEALRLAQAMHYPYSEAKVLYASGCLSLQQGESAQASASFVQALVILSRLGERLYAQQIEAALP
jgi:tetratricopeptide (TPR) repeat protein